MKRSSRPHFKRINKTLAACIVCMTALTPTISLAANATVNFGFSSGTSATSTAALVAPDKLGTTTATAPPVFAGVQATTEMDTSRSFTQAAESAPGVAQPVETTPSATPQQAPKSTPRLGVGVDTLWSDDLKIYTVPLSYTFNRNFAVQINIPVVTARFDGSNDGVLNPSTTTGIGDVSLTLKHRIGSENARGALFTLLTGKFASGDANRGHGTGTYDIALTEKLIKRFDGFRGTIMVGVTQPLNKPTVIGNQVEYGSTVAYMAALEHTIGQPDLWVGVRAEGQHGFQNKINGIALGDARTTLDVAPELRYYYKRTTSLNLGVNVPVYTQYDRAGSSGTRDVSFSFGVSTMF